MVTVIKKGASKKSIQKSLRKLKKSKGFNPAKHSGVLKLDEDPLEIQKRLRNEWG